VARLVPVMGDVHDIVQEPGGHHPGSNNGYEVVNLGIKQPLPSILDAASEHRRHVSSLSGLWASPRLS